MKIDHPDLPVIFIMGPTASGKTALAIDLFQSGRFEIISVDSAMVFTQMTIGSAKPSDRELVLAPHHLIDFVDPKKAYSASNFCHDAKQLINQIHARGKIPLLVGGTMLYFKALKDGLADLPETNDKVRAQVNQMLDERGVEQLHQALSLCDPVTAARLHVNDTQRISRALEVFLISGRPMSAWHAEQTEDALPNPLLAIALAPQDRQLLHLRIKRRFEQMLEQGFLDEMAALYYRGDLSPEMPSMRSVGYRQFWQYLDGELSLSEATEKSIIATRQLAKRQYTWLRSWPDAVWFDPFDPDELAQAKSQVIEFASRASMTG